MSGHESTYKPASGFTKWLELLVHIWRHSRHLSGYSDHYRRGFGHALYSLCE
jgi:hypothetical protein